MLRWKDKGLFHCLRPSRAVFVEQKAANRTATDKDVGYSQRHTMVLESCFVSAAHHIPIAN